MIISNSVINEIIPNRYSCNLCNGPIVRISRGDFGLRCLFCKSTYIHRALCHAFEKHEIPENATIYELSCHGSFYKYLKKRFVNLTSSDFVETVPFGTMSNGKLIQNVEKLSFFSDSFDVVTSTEVFEHVAFDAKGFKEIHRVLKKSGQFVFTVPLDINSNTITRAHLTPEGKIEHILPPEYHGDYLRKGILAFRNYGVDIKDRLISAGFSTVVIYNIKTQFNIMKAVVTGIK